MSRLHVTQLEGVLDKADLSALDMSDSAGHSDPNQLKKRRLTRALAAFAVARLAEREIPDLVQYVTDGARDGGIDLIYFDPQAKTLYLVQSKWHETGRGSISLADAIKFLSGVKKVLKNDLSTFNEKVRRRSSDIERALYDTDAKFVLVIAHTGQDAISDEVSVEINEYVSEQNDPTPIMSVTIMAQRDLHNAAVRGIAGVPISLDIQLRQWGEFRDPYYAVYGQVVASDVAAWYAAHGISLFADNIRQFITRSSVNDDIVSTLIHAPHDFWYYNNGLTLIADTVAKKPFGGKNTDFGIFECKAVSVVNGAQTVGAIHAAFSQNPDGPANAFVSLRIIATANSPASFKQNVTRNTNTQNAIEKRDFVALDPQQERLQQELAFQDVRYLYKTGSTSDGGVETFDLVDATIALACSRADVAFAVQAKREISRLWEDINSSPYTQLFNPTLTGPALWDLVRILRAIDSTLQAFGDNATGRVRLVCIHGNRFIAWLVFRTLSSRHSTLADSLSAEAGELTRDLAPQVAAVVDVEFSASYPASVFKNLSKCRQLSAHFGWS